jgi:virulence-associated protein VagC
MAGKIVRRVFKINTSKAITLPPEWSIEEGESVILLFNRYLLLVPAKYSAQVDSLIDRVIRELVSESFSGCVEGRVKVNHV